MLCAGLVLRFDGAKNVLGHDLCGTYCLEYAMNERIKELMEQAKRPLGELRPEMANTGAKWDMVLDPEKFAESIVRECLDEIANYKTIYHVQDHALGDIRTSIKEKFGVEE